MPDKETADLKDIPRFHLIFGDEFYLVKDKKRKLIDLLSNEGDDMNFIVLSGEEADVRSIADFGNLAPFMADNRLIVIEDSGYFENAGEKDDLKKVLDNLPDSTYVIFSERQVKKTVAMYKWFKSLEKSGKAKIDECKRLDQKKLKVFISRYLARYKKRITKGACDLIVERLGDDMMLITSELDKLIGYVGSSGDIREEDVEAICGGVVVSKVFEMVNAVSRRDADTALMLYSDLMYNKEEPLVILSLLGREFLAMYRAKTTVGLSGSKEEIAVKLGLSERQAFRVGKIRALSSKFSTDQLKEILRLRAETDENIKTGAIDRQTAVEIFLISSLTNR